MILYLFAFLSGFITILAPCIWPILPIILSSSISKNEFQKSKSLGIALGVVFSFSVITLFISVLLTKLFISAEIFRILGTLILVVLGLALIFPRFLSIIEAKMGSLLGRLGLVNSTSGFWGGLVTGLSLGLVWSPCAGPILATVATLAAMEKYSLELFITVLSFSIGLAIPLFLFSFLGGRFISTSRHLNPYLNKIQKFFGILIVVSAILIYFQFDKVLQATLLEKFPALNSIVSVFDSSNVIKENLGSLKKVVDYSPNSLSSKLFNENYSAPEIKGIESWLNTPDETPLNLQQLTGKVILIDFWTYSCINCIRTFPYLKSWHEKYSAKGLVIIGVHTPEFAFEKDKQNVMKALEKHSLKYPVALDNDYETWNSFDNLYWPAHYLIDKSGKIVKTHFGEGKYDEMEAAIVSLLGEKYEGDVSKESINYNRLLSRETYLGTKRMEYFYPSKKIQRGTTIFPDFESDSVELPTNYFHISGKFDAENEFLQADVGAKLKIKVNAKTVYLVAKPSKASTTSRLKIDIQSSSKNQQGIVNQNVEILVKNDDIYELMSLTNFQQDVVLTLEVLDSPLQMYAFTFGD